MILIFASLLGVGSHSVLSDAHECEASSGGSSVDGYVLLQKARAYHPSAKDGSTVMHDVSRRYSDTAAPSVFVAVATARSTSVEKHNAVREMWKDVDGGSGAACVRFAVCSEDDENVQRLKAEHKNYGDILFLSCHEGYAQGLLTKKTLSIMEAFRHASDGCLNRPLLMKVDDDTFVAGHRFRSMLSEDVFKHSNSFLYAGVPDPPSLVIRDNVSEWYEPEENYPEKKYPEGMYGGPGYILGRRLVEYIVDENVAESMILWNEDRAMAVWVNMYQRRGLPVAWFNISGTNGFKWDHPVETGSWGDYPYVFHHHLDPDSISCMVSLSRSNNRKAKIDDCLLHNSKRLATDKANGSSKRTMALSTSE